MQRESQEQQLGFGCAIISMFGFAITIGMFFFLMAMLALWVKAQPHKPTLVTIVVTSTPQAPFINAPAQVALIVPTNTPVPTPLPTIAPTNTPLSIPAPTQVATLTATQLPTTIPSVPLTATFAATQETTEEFSSNGLGLSRSKWEKSHNETGEGSLGYSPPMGIAYDNKYNVIFMSENVWQIERGWATNNFISLQDAEIEGKTLIPLDSRFLKRYSPAGRPETIVDVYMSESLKKRFSSGHWVYAEIGTFIIHYNVYNTGVGSMIISIDDNP